MTVPAFRLEQRWTNCASDKETYVEALRALQLRAPDLLGRVAKMCATRRRTCFAQRPEALFPGSPHLAEAASHFSQIVPGWYADTNLSNRQKERILVHACVAAGLEYLTDFEIRFEAGHYSPLSREEGARLADKLLEELRRL